MCSWPRFLILTAALLCATAIGHCTDIDYLAGIGDFEKCSATKWYTDYTGSDYDFYARPGAVRVDATTRKGFYAPLPDDSVADGWGRLAVGCSGPNKWNNIKLGDIVCRISNGTGLSGTNSQFFSIKGRANSSAALSASVCVSGGSYTPSAGDKLVLRIDKLVYQDYDQVPVKFSISLTSGGQTKNQALSPSAIPSSAEASLTLSSSVSNVDVSIGIAATDNLGTHQPGIYVDGVHLFVRRSGQSANLSLEEAFPGTRGLRTIRTWYNTTDMSAVEVARNYDLVVLQASSYWMGTILRKVNPGIRVHSYQPVHAIDTRDADGRNPYFPGTPVDFKTVLSHPEWLYAKPSGDYYGDTDYSPPPLYVRFDKQSFRDAWARGAIDYAKTFGFDGVFVDCCSDIQPPLSPPTRMPWEAQQFVHDVFPKLKAAGLDVIQNGSGKHRIKSPGERWWESGYAWYDITWTPTAAEVAQGYSPNSPANLPNGHFEEGAFFGCASKSGDYNRFISDYWLKCLADMDVVKQWNTAANAPSDSNKQWEYMHVWGRDDSINVANGIDGWLQFGLCSYLLAENNWTAFSWSVRQGTISYRDPNHDLAITKKLGAPDGSHTPIAGDAYFRYRRYKATADGGVGGVVVVNGNTDAPRNYTLDIDALDESGSFVPSGTVVTLKPNTGRIFIRQQNNITITISTPTAIVAPGQIVIVTVGYVNNGDTDAKNVSVQVSVPDTMTYIVGSAEATGGVYSASGKNVRWIIPTILAHAQGTKTFSEKVN